MQSPLRALLGLVASVALEQRQLRVSVEACAFNPDLHGAAATIGPPKILKVLMAKKAPAVVAPSPEAARTKPLQIPDTGFKTIWQVVGAPPMAAKAKGDKSAVSA
ncbi:MAG: hypothetical protein H7172_05550 [Ferruginibacter sp.]|nr:hypothetical protein [Rhodoferax sp.]